MPRFYLIAAFLLAALPAGSVQAQEASVADSTIALPAEWSTYYVVLLREGPAGAAGLPADEGQAVMSRHIQYQLRLQRNGQAVAGGGFGQQHEGVVGMTLLRAGSLEEAERLAKADPAAAAGRFLAVVYEWYVPAGRLPEP